jgi:hypothetical protein
LGCALFLPHNFRHPAADTLAKTRSCFRFAGIRQQGSWKRRPTGCQRLSGRSYVQSGKMPVADVLFMHCVQRRLFKRKGRFDKADKRNRKNGAYCQIKSDELLHTRLVFRHGVLTWSMSGCVAGVGFNRHNGFRIVQ